MFIQIGNHGFNTDHITRVHYLPKTDAFEVYTSDGSYTHLTSSNADDFAQWWNAVVAPLGNTEYWAIDADPMAPDYAALAAEEPNTAGKQGRVDSGYRQV